MILQDDKINLILQLVIRIAKVSISSKDVNKLLDDYGFWEDTEQFKSGEQRN